MVLDDGSMWGSTKTDSTVERRQFIKALGVGATVGATGVTGAAGQQSEFPSGEIRLIVPWAAGGGTDRTARKLASLAENQTDASYFVTNITGGSGSAGFRRAANAKPDGTTVGVLTVEVCTISHLNISNIRPDDFAPVMQYNFDPASLTVHQDAPYDTVEGFVKHVKNQSGQLAFSNSGIGAIWHLSAAMFAQEAGISNKVKHVGYDGGAPAAKAVASGEVDATTTSAAEVAPLVKDGPLKILGVMGENRVNIFPETKTLQEQGFNVKSGAWRGLGVPVKTPENRVNALNEAFKSVYDSKEFKTFMKNNGFGMVYRSSDEYDQFMQSEYKRFGDLIKTLGIGQ
ncbi:tripartite tricarboxylate transporter substrate binding protein (plasmid) [Halorussus limi]|uniref:Tripartite tricarboxylate transporter substrate binding protein n=1 Tax=Halorussus limi TaxID=2938695 RepID=A0A8U0I0B6_9EURY|nr:tripartite tricarboxylate transporter substrate binding protein [Halorussus limi]UPV76618.1 tripartite tricarboxylate transporter substrate binding protein [Halorussus limi]